MGGGRSAGSHLVPRIRLPPFDAVAAAVARPRYPCDGDAVPYLRADIGDLEQARALAADNVAMLWSWQRSPTEGYRAASAGVVRSLMLALDCPINNAGVFDPERRCWPSTSSRHSY